MHSSHFLRAFSATRVEIPSLGEAVGKSAAALDATPARITYLLNAQEQQQPAISMDDVQNELPPLIDLVDDDDEPPKVQPVDKGNNKVTCPFCAKEFVLLARHLLKCGPKHEVSPSDLAAIIEQIEMAARDKKLAKKAESKAAKKPSKPRQPRKPKEPGQATSRKKTVAKKTTKQQISLSSSQSTSDGSQLSQQTVKSKYIFLDQDNPQPRRPFKPVILKNGRLVAFKDLLTYEELITRINKMFLSTIPSNKLPPDEEDSENNSCSQKVKTSSSRAFEASKFLTTETFTARGFCKYIQREKNIQDSHGTKEQLAIKEEEEGEKVKGEEKEN